MADNKHFDMDFGFSFVNESDLESVEKVTGDINKKQSELVELESELEKAREMHHHFKSSVFGFLNNLKQDPDKDTIKWPNRAEAVSAYIKFLEDLEKE